MTEGRCDYVDSMFRGSPKQVNLLARAERTPGTCHSLPNEPLITGVGGGGGGCQSDASLGELAGRSVKLGADWPDRSSLGNVV